MGASDDRERVEVELVSGGADDSAFARPSGRASPVTSRAIGDRHDRRVIVIASVVALVALALGWILGRSAADSAAEPVVGANATAVARTAFEPIDPAGAAATDAGTEAPTVSTDPPVTVPVSTTGDESGDESSEDTSADDDDPVVTQVDVAAAVAGQPVEIVTYGNGRLLQRLDLSDGSLTTQSVSRQPFGRPRLVVGDDWLMFPTPDPELPTIVVSDDGEVSDGSFGPTWQVAGTSDGSGLWVMSAELADGGQGTIERVPISSGELEQLLLPGPPSRFDPRGGFVVDAPGGSYRVSADSATQITDGELIAIGRDVAVAEECDAELSCMVVVIDRSSGDRRPLGLDRPLDDSLLRSIAIVGGESITSDGNLAMIRVVNPADSSSGQATIGVIDLITGEIVEIGPTQDIDQSTWSPDGRFLFYNRGGKVLAFDPATGDSHVVADEVIAVDAFGVRPVSDSS